jgi:ribosome-binding factor A
MNRRKERLEQELMIIISKVIIRDLRDPRIGFVTVNGVELNSDLKEANVFVSVYGEQEIKDKSMEGLKSATKRIQEVIAHQIKIKSIPHIHFCLDDTIEKAMKLDKLLDDISKENQDEEQ